MSGSNGEGDRLLEGHLGIVTGGASGIGAATARTLARHGTHVAVLDVNLEAAKEVAESIGGFWFQADVTDPDSTAEAVGKAVSALGGLTLAFNNAGGSSQTPAGGLEPCGVRSSGKAELEQRVPCNAGRDTSHEIVGSRSHCEHRFHQWTASS